MFRFYLPTLVALAAMLVGQLDAGCRSCGCNAGCKVCRLVPDVTKVTTYEYAVECEEFCLHGRSKCLGFKQVWDCCTGCAKCEKVMQPTCSCIKTKGKLVKIPVVKEKHGWKCVVVSSCGRCGACCADAREATAAETQLAVETAEKQGILQVSAEEPIFVTIPDEAAAAPQLVPESQPAPTQPEVPKLKPFFGFFGK